MTARFRFMLSMALLTGLTACGGGGDIGSSTPTSSTPPPATPPVATPPPPGPLATTAFPLHAAYQAYVQTPATTKYSGGGRGGGAAITAIRAAPLPDVFEGVSGYSVTVTSTVISYASNSPSTETRTDYYSASWVPIGSVSVGLGAEYDVYQSPTFVLPASVRVGDSASVASINRYSSSTKTELIGTESLSFVVEADGSSTNTAIVNIISQRYNATSGLLGLTQSRYRISTSGAFSLVSIQVPGSLLTVYCC
jgi:hypothetical protein